LEKLKSQFYGGIYYESIEVYLGSNQTRPNY
jgi:hypothetical protein